MATATLDTMFYEWPYFISYSSCVTIYIYRIKNLSGKGKAGKCNINFWWYKIAPFLGLKNTCMVNQCAPGKTKLTKDKCV